MTFPKSCSPIPYSFTCYSVWGSFPVVLHDCSIAMANPTPQIVDLLNISAQSSEQCMWNGSLAVLTSHWQVHWIQAVSITRTPWLLLSLPYIEYQATLCQLSPLYSWFSNNEHTLKAKKVSFSRLLYTYVSVCIRMRVYMYVCMYDFIICMYICSHLGTTVRLHLNFSGWAVHLE